MVHVEQLRLEWGSSESRDANHVVIDPETTAVALALVARALLAVVRAVREVDDER